MSGARDTLQVLLKQHDNSSSLDVTIPILKMSILMLREFKFPKIPSLVHGKDKSFDFRTRTGKLLLLWNF